MMTPGSVSQGFRRLARVGLSDERCVRSGSFRDRLARTVLRRWPPKRTRSTVGC